MSDADYSPPSLVAGIYAFPFTTAGTGGVYPTATAAFNAGAIFVWMMPGTYTDTPTVPVGGVLVGEGGGKVLFQPTLSSGSAVNFTSNSSSHNVPYYIDGITVDGTNCSAGCVGIYGADTTSLILGPRLVVQNFTGTGSAGVELTDVADQCENWVFDRCYIINCTLGIWFTHGSGGKSFIRGWGNPRVRESTASQIAWQIDNNVNISESEIRGNYYLYTSGTGFSWSGSGGTGLVFTPHFDTVGTTATVGISVGSTGQYKHFVLYGPTFDGTFTNVYSVNSSATWGTTPQSISVTASPFTFTAPVGVAGAIANGPVVVNIAGGTVSAVTLERNGLSSGTSLGITSGQVILRPGDSVIVTYSSAPTMTYYEMFG